MGDFLATGENCVSCRTSSYAIQQLTRLGLPVGHVAAGTGYTLEELQDATAFIPWNPFLVFFQNAHQGVSDEQFVSLCTSYDVSPFLRPLIAAAGLWYDPARYFEWVAAPDGAIPQLFRCLETRCERVGKREVILEARLRPEYAAPPDLFWESQAIGFGALTTYFGLGPSVVHWEPIDRGAAFRILLPRRRPLRQLFAKVTGWFRRAAPDDLRASLLYGHERSLRLEREAAARKQAESALQASEERLRRITDAVPGIVYQYHLDPDGRQGFTFISGGASGLTGYSPAELLADAGIVWRQVLPEFVPGIQASIVESARAGTPWHQEFQFRTKDGDVRWIRGHSVPDPADETGRVVWNGILTDITDQKQAEEQAREHAARLEAITATSLAHIHELDPDGVIRYCNRASRSRTVSELIGRRVTDFLQPTEQNRFSSILASVFATSEPFHGELVVPDGAGNPRTYAITIAPIRGDNQTTRVVLTAFDVTDRMLAEESVRYSEARFRKLVEKSNEGVALYDVGGTILYESPAAERIKGFTPQELLGMSSMSLVHPDDLPGSIENLRLILAQPGATVRQDIRCRHKDGSYRWLDFVATNHLQDPAIRAIVGNYRDITDQRAFDITLRARDKLLRKLSEQVPGVIYQYQQRPDGRSCFPYASEGIRAVYEVTPEEVRESAATVFARLHPDDLTAVVASITRSVETLEEWRCEYRVRLPVRGERWLEGHAMPERLPDGSTLWHGHISDITERVTAEQALRESERRLTLAIGATSDAVWEWNLHTGETYYSPRWYEMLGFPPERPMTFDTWKELCHPDDYGPATQRIQRLLDTPGSVGFAVEFRMRHADGGWRHILGRGNVVERDPDGLPRLLAGTNTDVTERLRAEGALRDAEYRQRLALDAGRMGTWDWDAGNGTVVWDARQQELFGFAPGEYDGHPDTFFTRLHPADATLVRQRLDHTLATGEDYEAEFRACPRPGTVRWLAGRGRLLRDESGRPVRMIGINYDRTDEKRTLLALEEAERHQRLALDAGRMGTWDWEIGTDRLDWDDREQALFGFPPGTFDGRLASFLSRVHPDDLAAVRQVLAAAAAGKDFDGEFRIVWPSGEVRWIHGSGAVSPGNGDRPARLIGINYDVTNRVLAEETLRDSIREKEAMLKEIHHRVKNNLQVISSLLNLQAERIPDPDARAVFQESQNRVRAMALVHETLYGSESLARIGLPRYIDRLCDSLLQTFGGNERVAVERTIAAADLDLDRALPVGLIVSELVSNALKYAFPRGRAGRIRVSVTPLENSYYGLTVSDDGVGLPPDLDLARATTLGLYLVRVLTQQLRGTLEVGRAGGGASFLVRFPA